MLALPVLPRWGKREAASITRRDVLDLMDALVDGGLPIGANRVLAAVRKMFGWAVGRDILPTSPVVNVRAPGRQTERDQVLTDEELKKVWEGAERKGGMSGAFLKTLILTAQPSYTRCRKGVTDRMATFAAKPAKWHATLFRPNLGRSCALYTLTNWYTLVFSETYE